jgi:hypothetical protein
MPRREDCLTALAVAYQVETALSAAAPFMVHGFDLTTPLTYSLGAGLSKALGLDEAKTAAAVAISDAGGIPLLVVRATPISQWKGLNSSQVAFECVQGVFLASRGVTGPNYVAGDVGPVCLKRQTTAVAVWPEVASIPSARGGRWLPPAPKDSSGSVPGRPTSFS